MCTTRPVCVTWLGPLAALAAALGCHNDAPGAGAPNEPIETVASLPATADELADEKPGFIAVLTSEQQFEVPAPYTSASANVVVKLGEQVARGQVLAHLDDRDLRQELEAAKAQQRTALAAINQAVVERRGAERVLRLETGAEAANVTSHADVEAAAQAVAKAKANLSFANATAEERNTRITQLQAHQQQMTLVAPIAGSVAMIYPQNGARVEEGHPVVRIISGGVLLKFAIPADKVGTIKPGDTVDVRVDRRADPLTATVGHVSPELDAVAQMIIADAQLVNPPADLQPGTVCRLLPRPPRAATAKPK
jgi:multidrug efflux pump subunit AcrA (membrane-fusion protein)